MYSSIKAYELIVPEQFAPQAIAGSPGADAYARDCSEASLATAKAGVTPIRLAYGLDPAHRIDIFSPPDSKGLPVFMFLHGGAWTAGYLWWLTFMAPGVMAMPAVFVAVTYRLAPNHRFPAQLDDAVLAFQWVRAHIAEFGGDRERIFVGGHSAGAQISALLTLRGDLAEDPPSAHIRACFPISCPCNLQYSNPAPGSGEERTYKNVLARPEDDRLASPVEFVQGCRTPFHVVWGEKDFDRIVRTNGEFTAALEKEGTPHTVHVLAEGSHFDTHLMLRQPDHPWYARLARAMSASTAKAG